jgi:hypothetical protein
MRFVHTLATVSWSVLLAGLAAAYASAGAGLTGVVDVRRASLAALIATTVAFCAMIAHFVAAASELKVSDRVHDFK